MKIQIITSDPLEYAPAEVGGSQVNQIGIKRLFDKARTEWRLYLRFRQSKYTRDRADLYYTHVMTTLVCLHVLRGDSVATPSLYARSVPTL